MIANLRTNMLALLLVAGAPPATAQWTRVIEVQATSIFSVSVKGDTILAGADSLVSLSTDGGLTWKTSAPVTAGATSIEAVTVHNGRLYAGTLGQGVFVSTDLGDTWAGFNQGLVGGIGNSQLFVVDLLVRGDSLFAATSGAGPWVRNLLAAGSWSHFGDALEPNQASNMQAIAAGGSRFLAAAGFNGMVFFRDHGQPDWAFSFLDNVRIVPGLAALTAIWTGRGWVVGANTGVFHSAMGQSPWTFVDLGLGTPLFTAPMALRGNDVFASFGTGRGSTIAVSHDDGTTWQVVEALPAIFTFDLAAHGNILYAARLDGLWRWSTTSPVHPATWGSVKSMFR